jgi:hypothetical protein
MKNLPEINLVDEHDAMGWRELLDLHDSFPAWVKVINKLRLILRI